MTVRKKILQQIIQKIDKLPDDKLSELLAYIGEMEELNESQQFFLSFAGSWKDIDEEVFDDLTINLGDRRANDIRSNDL